MQREGKGVGAQGGCKGGLSKVAQQQTELPQLSRGNGSIFVPVPGLP